MSVVPRSSSHSPRLATLALATVLGLILSGCAGDLLPQPPAAPARYTLDIGAPLAAAMQEAPADAPTLVVALPLAAAGYDSQRMVYLRQSPSQALEAYAFHEWADTPARLLAPLLVRALQQRGAFHAVLLAPSSGSGTLRLETELLRLHQEHGVQPSQVRLSLRAVLVDSSTRQALAWREFDLRVDVAGPGPADGAAAAAVATQRVLAEVAAFVVAQLPAQGPPRRGP